MSKKRFDTDTRQEQIAEAALEIVRTRGIKALNVAAVAEKVGMVPSALYRHFKSKDEIVTTVLELIRMRLRQNYTQVMNRDIDPVAKLHLLLQRHIDLIRSNNGIPRVIFSEEVIGGLPDKRSKLYTIIEDVLDSVGAIIRDGQRQKIIRNDLAAGNMAIFFLGMIQPAAIIWNLSDGEFDLVAHSQAAWKLFSESITAGITVHSGRGHP